MRFHKSELAFFAFTIALVIASGLLAFALYGSSELSSHYGLRAFTHGALVIQGAALLFGILYIYPLLRSHAREEHKLRKMTVNLSERSETLEHVALTDGLTGMQNRRYFDDALREYMEEFGRIDRPIGLLILDLDHFKNVNDTHGHDVGDEVLKAVAKVLKDFTRYHDVVARLGGEEFAVVTPNMGAEGLPNFANRLRKAVAMIDIMTDNVHLRVTTSIGVAVWNGNESPEELYRRADRMLYQAKREGRNRVCA
ncbi:GGDEF domain-containing protein [Notoacmeibacter sp. MSK16QG-6]|uniref:GGDEF domain-containing protein n=1 Tax=Notoacmeibacter sp. MSK16QG-6 TaxID=2957982 RepID=UPI0020A10634|nr:GGDEF domain-containing protein [Notoacmeibacter sp. MSK16QG-6]MCP1199649.1 GGDEF domain-containing protein [Notoacmeibacter sp. MSK16QG-6]